MARLYLRLLAVVMGVAWLSLALQVRLLIGARGLLPVEGVDDQLLVSDAWLAVALCAAAALGVWPRLLLPLVAARYVWYLVVCRDFLSFQWDNLLVECGVLALFLPRDRAAPFAHALFRVLLVKLYVESGVAKWQSSLHDWQDGSAMSFYYETAPLPAAGAWFAHHLPASWHALESRATLVLECFVPFLAFGPRIGRLVAFVLLTGFQLVNLATANYGFFVPLALALHVFLLDDADVERVARWSRLRVREGPVAAAARPARWVAGVVLALYATLSLLEAGATFGPLSRDAAVDLRKIYLPWHVVNTYHLFGSITRRRAEPEFQTSDDGETWVAHDLHFKPGDPARRPPYVAPHQPRVDFLLWFYGLHFLREHDRGASHRLPEWLGRLLFRMCEDPDAVTDLFVDPLPRAPAAVRLVMWEYHFTDAAERRTTGAWWRRTELGVVGPYRCPAPASVPAAAPASAPASAR